MLNKIPPSTAMLARLMRVLLLVLLVSPFGFKAQAAATPTCVDLFTYDAFTLSLLKLPQDLRLIEAADILAMEPENRNIESLFFYEGNRLVNYYPEFVKLIPAFDRYMTLTGKGTLSREHFTLLVKFLQQTYDGLRHYPYGSSWAYEAVQKYIAQKISTSMRNDSTFTVAKALELLDWFASYDIRFTDIPKWSGSPVLFEILRDATVAKKDTSLVEAKIIEYFEKDMVKVSEKIQYLASIRKNQGRYRVPDRLVFRIASSFTEWLRDPKNMEYSDAAIAATEKAVDVDFLRRNSKAVIPFREFLSNAVAGEKSNGVLFGIQKTYTQENVYYPVTELTGLKEFEWGWRAFVSLWRLRYVPPAEQIQINRKFLEKLMRTDMPIVFLLPADLNRTVFTKDEFLFLLEDPSRLARVTFVLGAYPSKTAEE